MIVPPPPIFISLSGVGLFLVTLGAFSHNRLSPSTGLSYPGSARFLLHILVPSLSSRPTRGPRSLPRCSEHSSRFCPPLHCWAQQFSRWSRSEEAPTSFTLCRVN